MTQKDELAQAQTKITDLENKLEASQGLQTQLDQANTNLKAAEKARDDEKARADKAETDLKAATDRAEAAEQDTKAQKEAAEKATKEAGDAKASEQRMTEQLAARGIKPVKKANAASENNGKGTEATAEELREQLSACTDPAEKFKISQQLRKLETAGK